MDAIKKLFSRAAHGVGLSNFGLCQQYAYISCIAWSCSVVGNERTVQHWSKLVLFGSLILLITSSSGLLKFRFDKTFGFQFLEKENSH